MTPGRPPGRGEVTAAWAATVVVMAVLAGDYRLSVAVAALVLAVAAVGVDLSVGSAGMLVFSAPAFMQVGAFASALVGTRSGWPAGVAAPAGMVAGLAAGFVLAVVVGLALRRVSGVGVALVTLFVFQFVGGVARQEEALGGTLGLSGIPPFAVGGWRAGSAESQAVVVALFAGVVLAACTRFVRSGAGRELLAVRGDPTAAAACGVDAHRRRFEAFVAGSLCATLAGSLYAHTLGYVSAGTLGLGVLMDLLLMVFLGGAGSLWGVLPGAFVVRMVPELWAGPERFEVLARGAVFLVVLTAAPGGLAGAARAVAGRVGTAREAGPLRPPASVAPASPAVPAVPAGGPGARPGGGDPASGPLLEAAGLARSFGGVRALDGVDLCLGEGELCAVVGPNGAGKTTLFNVLAGVVPPHRGSVRLRGDDLTGLPPHRRARLGLARTFQEIRLFPGLTVLDHALVGTGWANRRGAAVAVAGRRDRPGSGWPEAQAAASGALAALGLSAVADAPAGSLPLGWQRRVELARCLAARPALLLLDEPAAGLSAPERDELLEVIRGVAAHTAVLVVEHHVEFVVALAPRMIVLDGGRVIFDGATAAAVRDPGVVRAYLSGGRPRPGG